jgi:prepilin-type N-terminal cleavage/methylation domain-containing protein
MNHKGFTLMELMVTVFVLGILYSVALPRYLRVMEQSKAGVAVSELKMIANANRMYYAQYGRYTGWRLGDSPASIDQQCNSFSCQGGGCPGDGSATDACHKCNIIACGYVPKIENGQFRDYNFQTVNGLRPSPDSCTLGTGPLSPSGGRIVACARRSANGGGAAPESEFAQWGYTVDDRGMVHSWNGAPDFPDTTPANIRQGLATN